MPLMNKQIGFTNKKTLVASGVAVGLTAVLTAVSFIPRTANGAFDLNGLNQQVQHSTEQLNNHEARITNNENNIKDLQDKTGTPPSSNNVSAPGVVTPNATPTTSTSTTTAPASTAPTPVVSLVKTVSQSDTCVEGQTYRHRVDYYSDGSSKQVDQGPAGSCSMVNN